VDDRLAAMDSKTFVDASEKKEEAVQFPFEQPLVIAYQQKKSVFFRDTIP